MLATLGLLSALGLVGLIAFRSGWLPAWSPLPGQSAVPVPPAPRPTPEPTNATAVPAATERPLPQIDDPREAATILMLAIARAGRSMSRVQQDMIRGQIESKFELESEAGNELLARAALISVIVDDTDHWVESLMHEAAARLGRLEMAQLMCMLRAVAGADGGPNHAQAELILKCETCAGLRSDSVDA